MKYFPIFINTVGQKIAVAGGGETAMAKLRLLMKSEAWIIVYAADASPEIRAWANDGKLVLVERTLDPTDLQGVRMVYAADEDVTENERVTKIAHEAGVLLNIVDVLNGSDFITPAIVDRDPVTVAIGTEGAAPVLARKIKALLEEELPPTLGLMARIGQKFRVRVEALPMGIIRRQFWTNFYKDSTLTNADDIQLRLENLLADAKNEAPSTGWVSFVGAGPGDPELLTLKARKRLHEADVVIHDRLVTPEILELVRREAIVIETGKKGYGASWKQDDINALIIEHVQNGHHVVRLKSGDATIYGRLDEEIAAIAPHDISYEVVPGITSAMAGAASLGQSLTRRGRNSELRFLTGRDVDGFADHDWRSLAADGQTAAIYMGARAVKFMSGRLMMFGADGNTPITAMENVSRPNQRVITSSLSQIAGDLDTAKCDGPVVMLLGITGAQENLVLPIQKQEARYGA